VAAGAGAGAGADVVTRGAAGAGAAAVLTGAGAAVVARLVTGTAEEDDGSGAGEDDGVVSVLTGDSDVAGAGDMGSSAEAGADVVVTAGSAAVLDPWAADALEASASPGSVPPPSAPVSATEASAQANSSIGHSGRRRRE
jgi:hypothetical protein